jgi:hypothetical protein
MTGGYTTTLMMGATGAALAGFLAGILYFRALRRTAGLLGSGQGWLGPAVLTMARLAAAGTLFTALAYFGGALPLVAGFLGFLAARALALHSARRSG